MEMSVGSSFSAQRQIAADAGDMLRKPKVADAQAKPAEVEVATAEHGKVVSLGALCAEAASNLASAGRPSEAEIAKAKALVAMDPKAAGISLMNMKPAVAGEILVAMAPADAGKILATMTAELRPLMQAGAILASMGRVDADAILAVMDKTAASDIKTFFV